MQLICNFFLNNSKGIDLPESLELDMTGILSARSLETSVDRRASGKAIRLEFLDGLRAIAALAVLFEHGGYHFISNFAVMSHTVFSFGKFGLACFFLVSGFVIPFSLGSNPSLRRFWILRFFRLYPLYWFSLAAAILLYGLGVKEALEPDFIPHLARNTLVNLTMIEGLLRTPYAIGLYYTLTIEMVFYIVCSALSAKDLLRYSYAICWMALAAAATIGICTPLFLHRRVEMAGLFYIVCLASGAVLYRFYQGEISGKAMTALGAGVLTFVLAGSYLNYVVLKKADAFEHYTFTSVVLPWLAAWVLFLLLLSHPQQRLPNPLLWVGKISYSLYLLHPLVLAFFGVRVGDTIAFLFFAALSLLIASASYLAIERPAMRLGKSLQKQHKQSSLLSTAAG
jgi:peptidoglycan/LPS O-acetylase OafA/YrhL